MRNLEDLFSVFIPGVPHALNLPQLMILILTIWTPVSLWRQLGDADYVASLSPRMKALYGVKTIIGANGRPFVETPSVSHRLKACIVLGLITAAMLSSVLWVIIQAYNLLFG